MPIYSHSRISAFEQCPLKYRLSYIDKTDTEIGDTVEAFLGSRIHDALEKLYKDLKFHKHNTLKELLEFYSREWDKNWSESILVVRKEYDAENYRSMGERFITDYYNRYSPFNQETTVLLEGRVMVNVGGWYV